MRIRWLVALLTTVPLLGCSASSRQKSGLEPAAAAFLFARQHTPTPCELQNQTGPRVASITINGDYAAMRVIGINAPVHLSTTHARITLLDTTGDVDAKAAEFGVIDFSGDRGNVRLDSAWEINLNFTGRKFDGWVDARAAQAVRVLLPPGFTSGFEAIVQHKADVACRADICARVSSHKRDGKFVFTFGSGDPALHFISESGPVVIDSGLLNSR